MTRNIQFGSQVIPYALTYSARKSLGITVRPEGDVIVKAPEGTDIDKISSKVLKRAPWILRQRSFFLSFQPRIPARKYVSGETHLYLGRQYRLDISPGSEDSVKLQGAYIEVISRGDVLIEHQLKSWYVQKAKMKFPEFALPIIERFKMYKVSPITLEVRNMPTRWGSCTGGGKIILNPELMKAPRGCIEYVITHELCHLIHRDHNQKFIDLQTREMPSWEKWKAKLEVMLA